MLLGLRRLKFPKKLDEKIMIYNIIISEKYKKHKSINQKITTYHAIYVHNKLTHQYQ
jgi:hypothetical protein